MTTVPPHDTDNRFGQLMRSWRRSRQVSQLELSALTGVSTRHLSFIETGRAKPSRDMVRRLGEVLEVTPREQNMLLAAADYTVERHEVLLDSAQMAPARNAIDLILDSHLPYPAAITDRIRNIVRANAAFEVFLEELPPHLRDGATNVFRIVLHPEGLAPRLVNFGVVRANLLHVLERSAITTGAPDVSALLREGLSYPDHTSYPGPKGCPDDLDPFRGVGLPVLIRKNGLVLSFVAVAATIGTVADTAAGELALELLYPADDETAEYLVARCAASTAGADAVPGRRRPHRRTAT